MTVNTCVGNYGNTLMSIIKYLFKIMEVDTTNQLIEELLKYGVGYRTYDDPLFTEGNKFEQPIKKLGIYSILAEEDLHIKNAVTCNIPNCHKEFDTVFGYESHYNSCHRHLCNECHKNLPSAHLLDLHLSEKHDSFFAVQSKTKAMFLCYVLECQDVFMNPEERKDHCILKHKFPHNFRFDLRSNKKSGKSEALNVGDEMNMEETEAATLVTSEPKPLKTINFGHSQAKSFSSDTNYAKALTKNQKKKSTKILEDNKMVVDLMASLPE